MVGGKASPIFGLLARCLEIAAQKARQRPESTNARIGRYLANLVLNSQRFVDRSFSFGKDEGPRADTSAEKLAALPAAFDRTSGQGSLSAGNSSPPKRPASRCAWAN